MGRTQRFFRFRTLENLHKSRLFRVERSTKRFRFRVLHLRPLGQLSSQNKFGMYFFVCCFPKAFRALYFNKHSLKSQSPAHVFRLVSAKALLYNKAQADFL